LDVNTASALHLLKQEQRPFEKINGPTIRRFAPSISRTKYLAKLARYSEIQPPRIAMSEITATTAHRVTP
jgi:hypothetical protein